MTTDANSLCIFGQMFRIYFLHILHRILGRFFFFFFFIAHAGLLSSVETRFRR